MPWMSIIVWLISFLLSSSKKGVSTGKAALIATGAALGTWLLVDPSNPDNFFGVGVGDAVTDNNAGSPVQGGPPIATGPSRWADVADNAVTTAGQVITNPNTGTNLAIGGALFSDNAIWWILGGIALLAIK